MRKPLNLEEFSALAGLPAEEIAAYRDAGLLDPVGNGEFDEYDALRLRFVLIGLDSGSSLEEIAASVRGGSSEFPGIQLLYPELGRLYSLDEAAEMVGLSVEQIKGLRTATGLPGNMVEEGDLEAFRGVKAIVDAGFPWEAVLEASRVVGDSMRRFAETEIRLTHEYLHNGPATEGMDEREIARQSQEVVDTFLPVVDPLLAFLHRQHLLRAAVQDAVFHLENAGKRATTINLTVLFVDLSSFTALADVHGDEFAAEVLDRFDVIVRSLSLDHHGTLAKQIGDAFMLVFGDPQDSLAFALALDEATVGVEGFPAMRMGIHAGPVLYRVGDYVGSTVNIASRLASAAMPNEISMTAPVATFAEKGGLPVEQVGVRLIRGISEPLTLYRVVSPREKPGERDPVCGMVVGDDPAARLVRGGREFLFCSEDCLRRFLEDPDRYAAAVPAAGA